MKNFILPLLLFSLLLFSQDFTCDWDSPCLLFTKAMLPEIHRRIEGTANGKAWWEKTLKNANDLLQKTPEYPPRGGQWSHHYTCKKCGSSLKKENPTKHVCTNPDCKEAYTGWPYDDVPLMGQHMTLARNALTMGVVFQITGDKKYADKSREILLGYAERYLNYPLHDTKGKISSNAFHIGPQSLNEANWLIIIAQAFDCIQPVLSPEDIGILSEKMMLPAAELILKKHWGIHNICCWHDSAIGLTGLALKNKKLIQAAIFDKKGFLDQIATGITDDGMWFERAWGYHFFTMNALTPLAIAIQNTKITQIPERLKLMYDAPLHFVTPTYQLPAFHDSGRNGFAFNTQANRYELAYAWWRDPVHGMLVKAGKHENMEAVFHGAQTFEGGNANVFKSVNYAAAGFAIMRTQSPRLQAGVIPSNYLALDYGEHGGGHGHPDKLNIVLYAHNTLIAEDPGSIKYANPAHSGWYKQTLSHNTLVVDGKSQKAATGKCLDFISGDNFAACLAEAGPIYPNITARRAVALVDDLVLDLLWADATDDTDHQFDYAFHARGTLDTGAEATDIDAPQGTAYKWGTNWQSLPTAPILHATWKQNTVKLDCTLKTSSDAPTTYKAVGRGNPPATRPPFILTRITGKTAVFAAVYQILRPEDAPLPVTIAATRDGQALTLDAKLPDNRSCKLVVNSEKIQVVK